jgi:uncharacterized membrane protein
MQIYFIELVIVSTGDPTTKLVPLLQALFEIAWLVIQIVMQSFISEVYEIAANRIIRAPIPHEEGHARFVTV